MKDNRNFEMHSRPSVGPYMWVSMDATTKKNNRTFRLVIYGAYNAYGLIGSECNGVAILDEDNMLVVCDEIAKVGSGYYGPTDSQIATMQSLINMEPAKFVEFVNNHPRTRQPISC